MRIVGRTFKCAKPSADKIAEDFYGNEALEAAAKLAKAGEITPQDFEKMTVADLKSLAEEKKIDLGGAKVKADIIAAINAAEAVQ